MTEIRNKIDEWRKNLLDLSKRNALINCRTGTRGAVSIECPSAEAVWECIGIGNGSMTFVWKRDLVDEDDVDGFVESVPDQTVAVASPHDTTPSDGAERVQLTTTDEPLRPPREPRTPSLAECLASPFLEDEHLLTEMTDKQLNLRLRRLQLRAKESLSEQGVHSLFLAFGMLKWFESVDSDVEVHSPLMLVPVELDRLTADSAWTLKEYEDDAIPNYCLEQLLKEQFGLELPPLPSLPELEEDGRQPYLRQVQQAIGNCPRWEVLDSGVLGIFSFQKIAMWQDLGDNSRRIAEHPLCSAIGGDAAGSEADVPSLWKPDEFDDQVHPSELHTILDCDSSQLEAILAAKAGVSLVLDGPPGTGKSQTIANLIAEFLATGKTVLFVSEKAAALEVVKRRLDDRRLGDFCLECHSHKANKREVVAELARCLALPQEQYADQSDQLDELKRVRDRLNSYVRSLHQPREPLGITAYAAHGRLAHVSDAPATRVKIETPFSMTGSQLKEIHAALHELQDSREVIDSLATYPWRGCLLQQYSLSAEQDVAHHLAILRDAFQRAAAAFQELIDDGLLLDMPCPRTLDHGIGLLREAVNSPSVPPEWFESDVAQVAEIVLERAQVAEAAAKLQASLAKYDDGIENSFAAEAVESLRSDEDEWAVRVRPHDALTVREQHQHYSEISARLRRLTATVNELDASVADVVDRLTVPLSSAPRIVRLPRLVEIAESIAQAPQLRSAWFDAARRLEVKGIAEKCREEVGQAEDIRRRLMGRLAPEAFSPNSQDIIKNSKKFESFWSRLLGGFRSYRAEVGEMYAEPAPTSTRELLNDLAVLREYHNLIGGVRRHEAVLQSELIAGPDGGTDWNGVLKGLEAVEQLSGLLPVSDILRDRLCTEGTIDRDLVATAAQSLARMLQQLRDDVEAVRSDIVVTRVGPTGTPYEETTPRELSDWLAGAVAHVNTRVETLASIIRTIRDGEDVAVADLEGDLRLSEELSVALRDEAQLTARAAALQVDPTQLDLTPDSVTTARWLRENLECHQGALPHLFEAVVTSGTVRSDVSENLNELQSALSSPSFRESWNHLRKELFPVGQPVSSGITVVSAPLPDLVHWIEHMQSELPRLRLWMRFCESRTKLKQLGLEQLVQEILDGQVPLESAPDAFDARFYRLWLDTVYQQDNVLRRFDVDDHERLIERFRDLDRSTVEAGFSRIRSMLLNDPRRPHAEMLDAPSSSELGILQRECNKRRRHLPLRQLFDRIPTMLLRLKPCLMMSPLAVSTYLHSREIAFDLVIFDEASQVRPFDAVGAIYRGRQLVVAGDQKQLPPTSFFDRAFDGDDGESEDDEGVGNISDYESILDVCLSIGIARKRLRWHYRSKREALIAFSNHHFYENELVTFPSVYDADNVTAVSHMFVPDGRWKSGRGGGFNAEEARATADLIFGHFEQHPSRSLGVITFNQRQQLAVLDRLEELRKERPEMEHFFGETSREPLFVKNLENVQGDERDVILLSLGYGFDQHGKFNRRFGPLASQGGERRLNVAVTRARERITFVSSVRSHSLDVSGLTHVGPRLLKSYLEYAERGVEALGTEAYSPSDAECDSPFEEEVFSELTRNGFDVRKQVGCGGYRIDLAVLHPQQPGRFLLGVECDGAAYHSSKTARDRDRLRQSVLEDSLDWTIIRIWSTDWIRDRNRQLERVRQAYTRALHAEREDEDSAERGSSISEELEPLLVERQTSRSDQHSFGSIDEVSEAQVRRKALELLHQLGGIELDDLVRQTTRELGFQRTGHRIRDRIDSVIHRGLKSGVFQVDSTGRITAPESSESSGRRPSSTAAESSGTRAHEDKTAIPPISSPQRQDSNREPNLVAAADNSSGAEQRQQVLFEAEVQRPVSETSAEQRLLDLLKRQPNLKARQIARELEIERSEVNSLLYGSLKSRVEQNSEYRWRLR